MEKIKINQLKRDEYFRLKDSENAPLWVRGEYDRPSKSYSIYKYEDVNHEIFRKGSVQVYI